MQSWEWGEFQEAVGRSIFRYRVDSSDDHTLKETVGQFSLLQHTLPFGQSYLYIPGGPVVVGADYRSEAFDSCLIALANALHQSGAIFARIEPAAIADAQLSRADLRQRGFFAAGQVQPRYSTIVNLNQSETELFAAMKQKTRYNIRLAEKRGVIVREADRSDAHTFRQEIKKFWRLMTETSQRDHFRAHEYAYYEKMLETLSPRNNRALTVRLIFADYQSESVAAALVAWFGDTATYLHGASSSRFKQVMAPYMLHWSAMRQAKAAGLKKYDFWGVAPEDAPDNHPWSGITRFKLGFGGDRVSYIGAWELPNHHFWYRLYRWTKRLKKIIG